MRYRCGTAAWVSSRIRGVVVPQLRSMVKAAKLNAVCNSESKQIWRGNDKNRRLHVALWISLGLVISDHYRPSPRYAQQYNI